MRYYLTLFEKDGTQANNDCDIVNEDDSSEREKTEVQWVIVNPTHVICPIVRIKNIPPFCQIQQTVTDINPGRFWSSSWLTSLLQVIMNIVCKKKIKVKICILIVCIVSAAIKPAIRHSNMKSFDSPSRPAQARSQVFVFLWVKIYILGGKGLLFKTKFSGCKKFWESAKQFGGHYPRNPHRRYGLGFMHETKLFA